MTHGTCPVCNGTKRRPVPENSQKYKHVLASYDRDTDTLACDNCGGQYMFGQPRGEVRLREDGSPCHHQYVSRNAGRCLTEYQCTHCGDRYQIDSGD